MKKSNLKKHIAVGLTLAGAAFTPSLQADVTSRLKAAAPVKAVLFDRATNILTASGGALTNVIGGGSNPRGPVPGTVGMRCRVMAP